MIRQKAPAKLNLNLHITGKSSDDYHTLQSLVAFADINDVLTCTSAPPSEHYSDSHHYQDIGLSLHTNSNVALDDQFFANNLIYQAAHSLADYAAEYNVGEPCPTHITLEKNLPIGAGLGGGSSDAAATLSMLNTHWNTHLSPQQLTHIAAKIGSDIAACINPGAKWMSGTGNDLAPANIHADLWAVIVHPNQLLSAGEVYRQLSPSERRHDEQFKTFTCDNADELLSYLKQTKNHLSTAAVECAPIVQTLLSELEALPNARLTRMSGSGSACYALFDNEKIATQAKHIMARKHSDWWVQAAQLIFYSRLR